MQLLFTDFADVMAGEFGGSPELARLVAEAHRLMREWATGDVRRVAAYADQQGPGENDLFWRVAQAFVEMAPLQSRKRGLMEAILSWGRGRTGRAQVVSIPVLRGINDATL